MRCTHRLLNLALVLFAGMLVTRNVARCQIPVADSIVNVRVENGTLSFTIDAAVISPTDNFPVRDLNFAFKYNNSQMLNFGPITAVLAPRYANAGYSTQPYIYQDATGFGVSSAGANPPDRILLSHAGEPIYTITLPILNPQGISGIDWESPARTDGGLLMARNVLCGGTNGDIALPIQLVAFKAAQLTRKGVQLTWATASETNNYGFYVQRNGVDVAFIAGHGSTPAQHEYSCIDNPSPGQYRYRLRQVDLDGAITLSETILMDVGAPTKFGLGQNYPNPFNPSTQITFSITREGPLSLRVYDLLGREVATLVNENRKPGEYTERFDGNGLASGVYMYVLQGEDGRQAGRMVLSK